MKIKPGLFSVISISVICMLGSTSVNADFVYQEFADEEYPNPDKPPAIPTGGFYYFVNYNKPQGASAAKWRVKHGDYSEYEIDLPLSCWSADSEKLHLRMYSNSNDGMGHSVSWPECYDGTSWVFVGQKSIETWGGYGTIQDPPALLTDGDWDTYNVWREIGPYNSRWYTDYTKVSPRWYEEGVVWDVSPTYSCTGFMPPLNDGPVVVRKNRALPFKAQLIDKDGNLITDTDISEPPVIQITFNLGSSDATDITDDAVPVGLGTEGNQFEYTDEYWQYNLKTRPFTAPGIYTVSMKNGNGYVISPTCEAEFIIK